jgi:hypothetical protein
MRIRNIEFGLSKPFRFRNIYRFGKSPCYSECLILQISFFYLTVLRGECLFYDRS